jgi:hypothetical protein
LKQDKKDDNQVNDEDNYEAKSILPSFMLGQIAAWKLKSIAQYMNDFSKIITNCRAEIAKAKENK